MKAFKKFFDKNMSSVILASFLFYAVFVEGLSMAVFSTFESVSQVPKWFVIFASTMRSIFIAWIEFCLTVFAVRKWENALDDGKLTMPEIISGSLASILAIAFTAGIFIIALLGFQIVIPTEDVFWDFHTENLKPSAVMTMILIVGSLIMAFLSVAFSYNEMEAEKKERKDKIKNNASQHNQQQINNIRNSNQGNNPNGGYFSNQHGGSANNLSAKDLVNKISNSNLWDNLPSNYKKSLNNFIQKSISKGKSKSDIEKSLGIMIQNIKKSSVNV